MSERLTALDSTFLELEDADPSAHMHIAALMEFGPPPGGGAPPVDALRAAIAARLDALPRYRMRLSRPTAGGLSRPSWEEAEDFDVARHIRRAVLPAPRTRERLLEWAGEELSQRLERAVPLWEMVLADGLPGGRWALLTKTHHCLVDGVGAVDAAHLLLDAEPDPPAHAPPLPPPPVADAGGLADAALHLALHPREAAGLVRRGLALGELLAREEIQGAPHTSINEPIGTRRALREVRVALADAKRVRTALGGTVNDVVLAGVAGGLRALLLARGEPLPEAGLRAMVPLDVRAQDEHGRLGNRVLSLFVDLPVAEEHPVVRYERVRAATAAVKSSSQADGADTLLRIAGVAPPVLHQRLARTLFGTRLFNVTITNVPGPQLPLYALGARLESVLPVVPLAAEHAVGVAIISYDGELAFGVNVDRDAVPDADVLADGIATTLAELARLGRAAAHPA